jgi:hypothetical protein
VRAVVRAAFHAFSAPLEGRTDFMYLDSAEPRAFVTIGVGNLCPLSFAVTLPFIHPDGHAASRSEIAAAWAVVDNRQDLAKYGGMVFAGLSGNQLRLPKVAVDAMVARKLDETDRTLAGMFSDWATWPACGQLALISWAWAVGPHASYPLMLAALRERDFLTAAEECTINPQRGTIITRNARNRILLRNAGRVDDFHLDPDLLDWERPLDVSEADTQPELPNPASAPTVYVLPQLNTPILGTPIVRVDPSVYLQNKDDDPDDAA